MKKIEITYIGDDQPVYVWVRPVPPPETGGHKALKNEDFIDHQDLIDRNSYYKQVTEKHLAQRYLDRVNKRIPASKAEKQWNKQASINKRFGVPQINDEPIRRIPTVED